MKINFNYILFCLLLLLPACPGQEIILTRSRLMMGHVPVLVQIRAPQAQREGALLSSEAAYGEAARLEGILSEYREDSEISCLNREAGKGPCDLSPETFEVLSLALELHQKTEGAFDIRFASASPEGRQGEIFLRPEAKKGFLTHPQTKIGLGAIAKGYIVEAMSRELTQKGFPDHLISAGGDLVARGGSWEVGIQIPGADPGSFAEKQKLKNRAVASSGTYEQGAHILDPRTGKQLLRSGAVTIIADDLTTADALSTACFVLGPSETDALVKKFPGAQAVWVYP